MNGIVVTYLVGALAGLAAALIVFTNKAPASVDGLDAPGAVEDPSSAAAPPAAGDGPPAHYIHPGYLD